MTIETTNGSANPTLHLDKSVNLLLDCLFLAVIFLGTVYFKYLGGTSNEVSVAFFLQELSRQLDLDKPDWKKTHVMVLDKCASHKTPLVRTLMMKLDYSVVFTAPAFYLVSPVEEIFALLKKASIANIRTLFSPMPN